MYMYTWLKLFICTSYVNDLIGDGACMNLDAQIAPGVNSMGP